MGIKSLFSKRPLSAAPNQIEAAEFKLLVVHWKGNPCVVRVRELSDVQIQAIGNFSLIEHGNYKWSKAPKTTMPWSEYLAYANKTTAICRAALHSPSYQEIFDLVGKSNFKNDVDSQIKDINENLKLMPPGPAKNELEAIRDSLILAWDIILPDDFRAEIIEYALKINRTDIKKVTDDMLYNAAILAERGHGKPHDYIKGIFDDFNMRDIDTQAWIIFDERNEGFKKNRKRQ